MEVCHFEPPIKLLEILFMILNVRSVQVRDNLNDQKKLDELHFA